MKRFISRLKNNNRIKSTLRLGIIVFLFLYTFSIPSFSGRSGWYIISYFLMAALAGCTMIFSFLYSRPSFNRWFFIPIAFVIFAFLGTAFYSHCFIGSDGRIGWTTLVLMLLTLVVFYYAFNAIGNERLVAIVLVSGFLIFAFYFAFIYREKIIHLRFSSERIDTFFDNQNTIGFYFSLAYSLSLFLGLFYKKKIELLFIIPAIIFLFLGFFSGSRSFFITTVISSIVILFLKFKNHKLLFLIVLATFVGLFVGLLYIPRLSFLKDQFDKALFSIFGIGNSKGDTSSMQRIIWPGYAFYLAGRNLIIGYGVNGFSIYSGVDTYAHNNYAELLCDFGIIGFALFILCLLVPLILSFRKKEKEFNLIPILFFIFIARSFFGVVYYSKETYLVLSLLFFITKDCRLPIIQSKKKHSLHHNVYEVNI